MWKKFIAVVWKDFHSCDVKGLSMMWCSWAGEGVFESICVLKLYVLRSGMTNIAYLPCEKESNFTLDLWKIFHTWPVKKSQISHWTYEKYFIPDLWKRVKFNIAPMKNNSYLTCEKESNLTLPLWKIFHTWPVKKSQI